MMVFSFAYGKASDAQHDYEISYITRLVQDIESSGVLPGARSIAILGSIPSSPLLINSTKKFPLMDRLVPRHIRNDWWWGHMQLRYFGLSLKYSKLDATIKSMILAGKMTSLVERKHHDIFMDGDQIIIHFR
jgi:hypothetical protein